MRHYESKSAVCPFYRKESKQKIYCEGVTDGNSIHMAFDSPTSMQDYLWCYCYTNKYKYCLIANTLLKDKYDS